MELHPLGYLTPGVVPVGSGPEQIQQGAMRRAHREPDDPAANRYGDPVAVGPLPGTQWWPSPQDRLVNGPAVSAPNFLALQYASPGSANVAGLPGRPPIPAVAPDGSAPSIAR